MQHLTCEHALVWPVIRTPQCISEPHPSFIGAQLHLLRWVPAETAHVSPPEHLHLSALGQVHAQSRSLNLVCCRHGDADDAGSASPQRQSPLDPSRSKHAHPQASLPQTQVCQLAPPVGHHAPASACCCRAHLSQPSPSWHRLHTLDNKDSCRPQLPSHGLGAHEGTSCCARHLRMVRGTWCTGCALPGQAGQGEWHSPRTQPGHRVGGQAAPAQPPQAWARSHRRCGPLGSSARVTGRRPRPSRVAAAAAAALAAGAAAPPGRAQGGTGAAAVPLCRCPRVRWVIAGT